MAEGSTPPLRDLLNRTKGLFVAFDYSAEALTGIDRYFRKTGKVIVALTVKEIFDEQIAKKLAWSD